MVRLCSSRPSTLLPTIKTKGEAKQRKAKPSTIPSTQSPTMSLSSLSQILLFLSILPPPSLSNPVQPFLVSSSAASTIPAFPEQSEISSTCPLHLPPDIFPAITHACSSPSPTYSFRIRCCPSLAAWLLSSYAISSSPSLHHASHSTAAADLPLLPDDSESCIDSAVKTLRSNGVPLPPLNETCDVPYCFCGIRLRPFSCLSAPLRRAPPVPRKLRRHCSHSSLRACTRCLRTLRQIKSAASNGTKGDGREEDCELMGLTWLLATNRTRYLPAATKVLRALMATPEGEEPKTCSVRKGMPMAVDSANIDGHKSSSQRLTDCGRRIGASIFAVLLLLLL